jgi:hypothetical protein
MTGPPPGLLREVPPQGKSPAEAKERIEKKCGSTIERSEIAARRASEVPPKKSNVKTEPMERRFPNNDW